MKRSIWWGALASFLLTAGLAAAQTSAPPAPAAIAPPGEGMIEQPCPAIKPVAPDSLPEPGKPAKLSPEFLQFYAATKVYTGKYDWPWMCRYRAANAAAAGAKRPHVVFMGDSITELWALYDPGFFAGANADRGISGQTSPQMLLRFYQDVVALRPRVVHILAGTNDIAGNTGPTDAEAFKNNIRAMVELAQANNIRVVLGSILPVDTFPWAPKLKPAPQILALNAWLKAYAAQRGAIYADYYGAMVDASSGGLRKDLTFDGVHPATQGYRIMRGVAEKALALALVRKRPTP